MHILFLFFMSSSKIIAGHLQVYLRVKTYYDR